MNYQETCDYLYHQMPMFERQGASGYKEGLANSMALDEHFGHPHRSYVTIHVGGTNGKGSVSHTIASILQECGYRVGLYTSPHLIDFTERIRINGKPISRQYVIDFVEQERGFFEPLHPSFFEVVTAMAFKYFQDQQVDIAIIEVGLGGRLDCTNIITPKVSVITNVSFDHTQFLGNTLAEIAAEKAGIMKPGVPVVIGEANDETRPVFEAKAKEVGAPIFFADDDQHVISTMPVTNGGIIYQTKCFGKIHGDLGGIYQQKNLNTVFIALQQFGKFGFLSSSVSEWSITRGINELKEGIGHVKERTGLMGRWQIVRQSPMVICDTGHNVGAWEYLSKQLTMVPYEHLHIVFGMVEDKDIKGVLKLLPAQARYYFTKADNQRALNEKMLQKMAQDENLYGAAYPTVYEAYKAALKAASLKDVIFVGGSSYVVGDFLKNVN